MLPGTAASEGLARSWRRHDRRPRSTDGGSPLIISALRFAVGDYVDDEARFCARAEDALRALAARSGYLRGSAARATDDPQAWVLVTQWRDVGSYRRALGNYDVKVAATPLLAQALDEVSAYEVLIDAEPGAEPIVHASDRDPSEAR
jgi:heme oxygenase (mycobilin-producing)